MVNDIIKSLQGDIDKAIEAFQRELGKVRTGRANLSMLDGVRVDYYGTPTPLNQVASLAVADARLITIKPWEKSADPRDREGDPRGAARASTRRPTASWCACRCPPLTQERRKELVKVVKKMAEERKVAMRDARRDANEMLKEALKDRRSPRTTSARVSRACRRRPTRPSTKVDEITGKKESEILEV